MRTGAIQTAAANTPGGSGESNLPPPPPFVTPPPNVILEKAETSLSREQVKQMKDICARRVK